MAPNEIVDKLAKQATTQGVQKSKKLTESDLLRNIKKNSETHFATQVMLNFSCKIVV